MPDPDPFLIQPGLWFGVLCETLATDEKGRIKLERVFNTFTMEQPPRDLGIKPFAHFRAILAVGFSHGVGEFSAAIELQNVDGRVLWQTPEPWTFRVGPGETAAAIHAQGVEHWFTEAGNYYYVVRLSPGDAEHRVRFEVLPPPVAPAQPPLQP